MSICVKVLPGDGTDLCSSGAVTQSSCMFMVPVIQFDPDCSQGLVLLTSQEFSQIELESPVNADRVSDVTSLFYAFLLVLVSVWGVRRLAGLFLNDSSRD